MPSSGFNHICLLRFGNKLLGKVVHLLGDGGQVTVQIIDPKDPSANAYTISTDVSTTDTFRFIVSINTLNLLPGGYKVKFSKAGISQWSSDTVTYYIVLSKTSTFN